MNENELDCGFKKKLNEANAVNFSNRFCNNETVNMDATNCNDVTHVEKNQKRRES